MPEQATKNRWGVERRLAFIDFLLYWDGKVNRSDLVDFFGISVPQASGDLTQYQEQAEGNAVYNKSEKAYVAGPKFKPAFFDLSAEHYLAQLRLLSAGILQEEDCWVVRQPPYEVVPLPRRLLDAGVLRNILAAIRSRSSLNVLYQSLTSTEPTWRWIAPHALAYDGFRWHVRAWCHRREVFHDFLLARTMELGEARPAIVDPATDVGWLRQVTLRIGPHPGLKDGNRRAIELDYGMTGGVVEVTTRVCLSAYVERNLGLDLDPALIPPERQQIVLLNMEEVRAARDQCEAKSRGTDEKEGC